MWRSDDPILSSFSANDENKERQDQKSNAEEQVSERVLTNCETTSEARDHIQKMQ